ncbi:MAG TPA: hypothetical protein VGS61_06510, partial [Acidimicrobiales bacterium]|nr:hypothetical protein [Acidimicrobiales bacterium]
TLVVLVFARDVNRAAHSATGVRSSEDRSFAALANSLLTAERQFGGRLQFLLTHGPSLGREGFGARLTQLGAGLGAWSDSATLLRHPSVAGGLNSLLADLTEQRVDDYQVVLTDVARSLSMPWTAPDVASLTPGQAQSSLVLSDHRWDSARRALARLPGRATLLATTTPSAVVTLPTTLGALDAAPGLRLTRGVGIAAVRVTPAPLPAPPGTLLLPPGSSVHVGVVVTNVAYATQAVRVTVTLVARGAAPQSQTMTGVVGPLASRAFVPRLLGVHDGEHARLTIVVRGAPSAPPMTRSRTYTVVMSPSGA